MLHWHFKYCCKVCLVYEILDALYFVECCRLCHFQYAFIKAASLLLSAEAGSHFNWKEGNVMRPHCFKEYLNDPNVCLARVKCAFILLLFFFYLFLPVKNIPGAASCFCLPSLTQIPTGSFHLHLLGSTTAGPPAICQTHSEGNDRIQKVSTQSFCKWNNSFINQENNVKLNIGDKWVQLQPCTKHIQGEGIRYKTRSLTRQRWSYVAWPPHLDSPEVTWQQEDDGDHGGNEAAVEHVA